MLRAVLRLGKPKEVRAVLEVVVRLAHLHVDVLARTPLRVREEKHRVALAVRLDPILSFTRASVAAAFARKYRSTAFLSYFIAAHSGTVTPAPASITALRRKSLRDCMSLPFTNHFCIHTWRIPPRCSSYSRGERHQSAEHSALHPCVSAQAAYRRSASSLPIFLLTPHIIASSLFHHSNKHTRFDGLRLPPFSDAYIY